MLIKRCLLLFAVSLLGACGAENSAQANQADTQNQTASGPLLWKVTGDVGTAYLFGSVHALRKSDLPLDDKVIAAYKKADLLLMELDMDSLNPIAIQKTTMSLGTFKNGKTLKEALTPALYQRVEKATENLAVPLSALNRLEPWLVALFLQQTKLAKLGFNATQGVETVFTGMAVTDIKPIEGLETLKYQLNLFDDMPMEAQQEFLSESLNDIDKMKEQLDAMVAAWSEGDAAALTKLSRESFADSPLLYQRIVATRNKAWAEKLAARLDEKEGTTLMVVGALHLVGEDSVISLLEKRGLEVTRQ